MTAADRLRERFLATQAFVEPSWSNLAIAESLDELRRHCASVLGLRHPVTNALSHLKCDALSAGQTEPIVERLAVLRDRAVEHLNAKERH